MSVSNIDSAPSARMFSDDPIDTLSDDELGTRLVGHASQIASLTARFLELLAAFDKRGAWNGVGVLSCAHWLSWRAGMNLRTAHEHLRVARALTELPRTRDAFSRGELTYSKVRALTRVATPEREQDLINVATSATAEQVERVVRAMRQVERDTDPDGQPEAESSGRWKWNHDGTLSVSLRLTALDGAAFLSAAVRAEYERTRTEGDPDVPRDAPKQTDAIPKRDLWRHVPSDIAPAVLVMSSTVRAAIDIPAIAPGAEVLIHKEAAADSHLDNGPALTEAEVCEAECGAAVSETVHHQNGHRLWWGRERRYPTRRLVRFITQRDHSCRHPGCGRSRHLHVHHVKAWSGGGQTDPDNLILLCSTHHRALHRGVFSIAAHGEQRFTFHDPEGGLLEPSPVVEMPVGWVPNRSVAHDAASPVNGGKLHLDYAIEVLYRKWDQPRAA